MKFFADEMLGKLAHWLRMAGLDVAYQNNITDEALLTVAKAEDRILLTRDTHLIQRLKVGDYLFISHDHLEKQFEDFISQIPEAALEFHPFSRCSECNHLLEAIEKESVKDRVWTYVYETQDHFTHCPGCNRIYWPASHWKKIVQRLGHLLPAASL